MSLIVHAHKGRVERVTLSTGESVELVSTFGTDRSIAEAAWVSSARADNRSDAEVEKLVRYLVKHDHWTPLAHAVCQVRFRVPIFTARQLMRSSVGIVWNEESRRYVDEAPEFWGRGHAPVWRGRGENIKQGSGDALGAVTAREITKAYDSALSAAWTAYNDMLAAGCCPEQARAVLPVATLTKIVGIFSLPALARVVRLRRDSHAQLEIRLIAEAICILVRSHRWCPIAWDASARVTSLEGA